MTAPHTATETVTATAIAELTDRAEAVELDLVRRDPDTTRLMIDLGMKQSKFVVTVDTNTNIVTIQENPKMFDGRDHSDYTITIDDRTISGRTCRFSADPKPLESPQDSEIAARIQRQITEFLERRTEELQSLQTQRDELYQRLVERYPNSTAQIITAADLTDDFLAAQHDFGISFLQHFISKGHESDGQAFESEIHGKLLAYGPASDSTMNEYATSTGQGKGKRGYVRVVLKPDCNDGWVVRGLRSDGWTEPNGSIHLLKAGVYDLPATAKVIVWTTETPGLNLNVMTRDSPWSRRLP